MKVLEASCHMVKILIMPLRKWIGQIIREGWEEKRHESFTERFFFYYFIRNNLIQRLSNLPFSPQRWLRNVLPRFRDISTGLKLTFNHSTHTSRQESYRFYWEGSGPLKDQRSPWRVLDQT